MPLLVNGGDAILERRKLAPKAKELEIKDERDDWISRESDRRNERERCSVFCKLGQSPGESEESFSHSVCLADWLTEQYVQNPGIDLFSAFFLGVNF